MNKELEHLRHDIGVLEEATGLGLPFDERDARLVALGSFLGVPAAIWSFVGPTHPPVAGIVLIVTLLGVVAASSWAARSARMEQASEPLRWREHRFSIASFLFITLAALTYLAVGVWGGLSWEVVLPTAVFLGGVATAVPAIADRRRAYLFGGFAPTLAYAAVLPFCDDRQLMLATALWIASACALSAALMFWQLRGQTDHAAD